MNVNQEIEAHWKEHGDVVKFKGIDSKSYDMIRGSLVLYAYGRLKDWMNAEDAVQNAYVHMLSYPPKGEGHNFGGLFKLYLDRSIYDIKYPRHQKSISTENEMNTTTGESHVDEAESEDLVPDQAIDISGQTDLIMDMSDCLKPRAKHIVRLALIFGYSKPEVGRILKIKTKTVSNVLFHFRRKIKEHPRYQDLRT